MPVVVKPNHTLKICSLHSSTYVGAKITVTTLVEVSIGCNLREFENNALVTFYWGHCNSVCGQQFSVIGLKEGL